MRGKYVFHDSNRDINYSQVTMRNWLQFYLRGHPPIIHDLHESVPVRTMELMSQAHVEEIGGKAILDVAVEPVDKAKIDGSVKGDGPLLVVFDNGVNGLATLRY